MATHAVAAGTSRRLRGLALALLPLVALPLAAGVAAEAGANEPAREPFGRWERSLRQCRLERRAGGGAGSADPGANPLVRQQGCRAVRLDQQDPGLLSVRFLTSPAAAVAMAGQLAFAGVLEAGSRPMQCRELRCRPRWPIRLRVSAVALSGLAEEAGGSPLPQGRLAQGSCELSARSLRCTASGSDGEEWTAVGQP